MDGLRHLLQKRGQWLKRLEAVRRGRHEPALKEMDDEMQAIEQRILQVRQEIQSAQLQLIQAAIQEKNNIAAKLRGNKVTRNVRNAYIMRWYQGISRGFSRQG